jgi:transketolase C-terminal domain/subunit
MYRIKLKTIFYKNLKARVLIYTSGIAAKETPACHHNYDNIDIMTLI